MLKLRISNFLFLILLLLIISCKKNINNESDVVNTSAATSVTIEANKITKNELEVNIEKGKYLSLIAACGYCHSLDGNINSTLSGGKTLVSKFGQIHSPNITPDNLTGLDNWSVGEIKAAIRESIAKDNRKLAINAHKYYRWLSDTDSTAIALYLKSLPPIKNDDLLNYLSEKELDRTEFLDKHFSIQGYVPELSEKSGGFRGLYLVNFVHGCARCHSPKETMADKKDFLNGYKGKVEYVNSYEEIEVPSIRNNNEGISNWTEEKIINYFSLDSRNNKENKKICPTDYYSNLQISDKKAIAVYLKSLK